MAAVITELVGVTDHPAHVSRQVRALDHSPHLPETRATQRDEAAIQAWHDERWPVLKKRR